MQIITGKIESAQKCVVYGPEGIGKSTFAAQFPNPLFIDTEGSTKHMDVARTPKPSSWTMLLQQVDYVKRNPDICSTLIIDTADWAEQLCVDDICARHQKKGIEDFGYGKGYIYLMEEFGRLLNSLNDLIERGINVVLTAHAQMRKFEQPDEMGSYDRWEMKLQKKTAPLVKEWADMVLFVNYKTFVVKSETDKNKAQGGKRVMYTSHHPCWDAKNRHDLSPELPLDYSEIAHCIPVLRQEPTKTIQVVDAPIVDAPKTQATQQAEQQSIRTESRPAVKTEPKQQETQQNVPESVPESVPEGVPKALADLMQTNDVTLDEIQEVVAKRGYYPQGTPITNYDPDFISGVLVGAWGQVFKMIEDMRLEASVPF